jgi:hypothetical protein
MGKPAGRLIPCRFADLILDLPTNLSTEAVESFGPAFVRFGVAFDSYM